MLFLLDLISIIVFIIQHKQEQIYLISRKLTFYFHLCLDKFIAYFRKIIKIIKNARNRFRLIFRNVFRIDNIETFNSSLAENCSKKSFVKQN